MLWVTAGVVTLGFLVALEIAARRYDLPGPVTCQLQEVIFPPKSGFLLYASMALMMVVFTWRQRFVALGAALGIDVVFLVVRWAAGIEVTEGHPFGNGALWVILGCAVIAVTRRTGAERVLLLKGVGLALLLVAGRKTGDTWLLITSKTRPTVLDQYLAVADHALGNPSWVVGRIVRATEPVGPHVLDFVYVQLAVAAVVVALYQLRHVAVERRFPAHHLVRTFLVIGLVGPAIYMVFPVVGPVFAYGTGAFGTGGEHWAVANIWPETAPPLSAPLPMPYDEITPRNCMPSLHTAWAVTIFVHSRTGPRVLRFAGTFWLVATLGATLGFGYHYGVDLVAGVVFALTIEAALRAQARGWDRPGIQLVAYGATVFVALLVAYRFLPVEMADRPWLFGPLLLLVTASVILGFVRTTRLWVPKTAPALQPDPQPELV
ncbi:membrane protein [Streptomyces viridochromogenes]|uniref:Membrane protein n=1 Tax=Streptomyces viridochromogenes TaxID=1938 RepID=A0A0J8BRQ6_STRVR|nr:phosphatase PAP2 family protein [Streptomyces viridochromogenes]KMS68290.1 membrane protein [Streptomyces viridochromogenes]KOG08801.1 membrane protein [Streptomyces viridochromogenes]KOG09141.1 membrane protein [Streptomyces viridochromogenes]